jgi:predicted GNAT family acetyltransferase
LRLATLDDLHLVAPVHAAMAEAESDINPLEKDREGFLSRCARRINKNRVWVIVKDQRLIFKADIQAETPEVIYLEGVYVSPKARGLVR